MISIGILGFLLLLTLVFQFITLAVVVLRTKTKEKPTVIKDEIPAPPKVPGVRPFVDVPLRQTSEV